MKTISVLLLSASAVAFTGCVGTPVRTAKGTEGQRAVVTADTAEPQRSAANHLEAKEAHEHNESLFRPDQRAILQVAGEDSPQAGSIPSSNTFALALTGENTTVEITYAGPGRGGESLQVQPALNLHKRALELGLSPDKPNEMRFGKGSLSGLVAQFLKVDNLLQLFNPAAPSEYGTGLDNLVLPSFSGAGQSLKIFSLSF